MPELKLVVSSGHVEAWVGKGGRKPAPLPLVTLGLGIVPGLSPGGVDMVTIEMTPGQVRALIDALENALPHTAVDAPPQPGG